MNGSEKRCCDCEYFVVFRNMNYETCTCDTITEYCELLQNEDTYDRDKGDEIWNNVFDDCPLKTGYVSTESSILLLQSKKEVHKQFDTYVKISREKKKKLQDENRHLRKENVFLAKQRNYWKGIGKASVMKYLKTDEAKKISELEKENEQLKNRLYDFEKRKIIEESAIDEDIIPKIRLLRTELFGEK